MQLTPSQIDDDCRFWLNQDREHCLFFVLGLEDPNLKGRAQRLYDAYENAFARQDWGSAMQILNASQAFKQELKPIVLRAWVGWIYPAFVDHVHREMEFFLARTRPGGISSREELCFWNQIAAEHYGMSASLLDPVMSKDLAATINGQLRPQAEAVTNACVRETYPTLLALSKRIAGTADQTFSTLNLATTPSVIHPTLAAHIGRESNRFLTTTERLPSAEAA